MDLWTRVSRLDEGDEEEILFNLSISQNLEEKKRRRGN